MPVFPPGFSERVFEFGFNSEYSAKNRAVLAAAPDIPTQNEEKTLGYDVAFEIKRRGGAVHSVALQHKTCRFVDGQSGSNRKFWAALGGPYFGFRVNVDQFNLIETIASSGLAGVEFVYCAPLFSTRKEMNKHYLGNSVMTKSLWISPKGVGPITDAEAHSIVFDAKAKKAFLFSVEGRELKLTPPRRRAEEAPLQQEPIRLAAVYETVYAAVSRASLNRNRQRRRDSEEPEFRMPKELPPLIQSKDETRLIDGVAELLSDYVGVSWLVEVKQ
jgi:hypothetical protein